MKNCYIHIPFCEHICSYCDFCKMFYNEKLVDQYLEELEKEITSIYKGETLETIYIGGGTPSSLNMKQLKKLFSIINKLNISNDCEYTIEANFENITLEKLQLLKNNGVNRLSFGLESINQKNLKLLDRNCSKEQVINIIKMAKNIGFNNINVDLMYALPNEQLKDLEDDLDFIISLDINHISCYSLIIEEHTKLSINKVKNIDEDLDYLMYKTICNKMKANDFIHYEISNYAKKGYSSKHNLCYWNNDFYYGFGLGASSYINDERINNTRSINKYLLGNYIMEKEKLSIKDKIEYEIILNLRKKEGISLEKFLKKYNQELKAKYDYSELLSKGLLKEEQKYLFIPEDKWYISNEIIVHFLEGEQYE